MQTRMQRHAPENQRAGDHPTAASAGNIRARFSAIRHGIARRIHARASSAGDPTHRRWWASLAAVTLASIVLYACGTTGTTSSTAVVDVPFFRVGWNFHSNRFDVTSNQRNVCVTITWYDDAGESVGEGNYQTDGEGAASGDVPDGAKRFVLTIVPCPEESLVASPFASIALRDFLMFGGPIVPSDDAGADNLTYSFRVRATSLADARAWVDLVLQAGIGAPVPQAVEVLSFASLSAADGGARLLQAQPGAFEEWSLDFNDGGFRADLESAARYPVGDWEVLETLIPLSAFDYGITPGVTYSNSGTTHYKTDRMTEAGTTSYRFAFEH